MTGATQSASDCFCLDGRVAFVSGAAGHLGREMAFALSGAGARVIVNGRNGERLESLAEEIAVRGGHVETAAFDVGDLECVKTFFEAREALAIVVNNAVSMTPRGLAEATYDDFEETYRTAVAAPFEVARAARPALLKAVETFGDASIVNVSSMYGVVAPDKRIYSRTGEASPAHYGSAKAALLQLTRHLASEFGGEGIRVNALVPGPFPRDSVVNEDPRFAARLAARTMLRRVGIASEIGGPLLFLVSSASSFVTGTALTVDGGWSVW